MKLITREGEKQTDRHADRQTNRGGEGVAIAHITLQFLR